MSRGQSQCVMAVILGWLYLLSPVQAAFIYVDKDSACPGSGSADNPYCRLQDAFEAASAGDTVRIRQAATPYDEYVAVLKSIHSGQPGQPITVEPDSGHQPILRYSGRGAQRSMIHLRDVSYWRLRNLTFDGTGVQTSEYAVLVEVRRQDVTGLEIVDNTFKNWGGDFDNTLKGAVIAFMSNTLQQVTASLIGRNTFTGNRREAIYLQRTADIVVENNDIVDQRCGKTVGGIVKQTGIKIVGLSNSSSHPNVHTTVRGNTIRDFRPLADCEGAVNYMMGIWADRHTINGEISENVIYNISQNDSTKGIGILVESRSHNWNVNNNTLYNIGRAGIRNGNSSNGGDNNKYTNNTLYKAGVIGFNVMNGRNLVFKNNIVSESDLAIRINASNQVDGSHEIDYNLYEGVQIGVWYAEKPANLVRWQHVCQCDAHSLNADPQFLDDGAGQKDLRLHATSPARSAGEGGVNIGAEP